MADRLRLTLFRHVARTTRLWTTDRAHEDAGAWIDRQGVLTAAKRRADPEEWAWVVAASREGRRVRVVFCDALWNRFRVRHEHAVLVPKGARLPMLSRGPVFEMDETAPG